MSLPVVFRRIARQEMDDSIAWYEKERPGLGIQFAADIPYSIQFLTEPHRIVVLASSMLNPILDN